MTDSTLPTGAGDTCGEDLMDEDLGELSHIHTLVKSGAVSVWSLGLSISQAIDVIALSRRLETPGLTRSKFREIVESASQEKESFYVPTLEKVKEWRKKFGDGVPVLSEWQIALEGIEAGSGALTTLGMTGEAADTAPTGNAVTTFPLVETNPKPPGDQAWLLNLQTSLPPPPPPPPPQAPDWITKLDTNDRKKVRDKVGDVA